MLLTQENSEKELQTSPVVSLAETDPRDDFLQGDYRAVTHCQHRGGNDGLRLLGSVRVSVKHRLLHPWPSSGTGGEAGRGQEPP